MAQRTEFRRQETGDRRQAAVSLLLGKIAHDESIVKDLSNRQDIYLRRTHGKTKEIKKPADLRANELFHPTIAIPARLSRALKPAGACVVLPSLPGHHHFLYRTERSGNELRDCWRPP